jgi:murein DD-endopeptidase MepM/ murein hydrolase activator NlpD
MRFLKVVAAFFLVGFVAGSLEAASGLGHSEQSRVSLKRNVEALIERSSTDMPFSLDLANDLRAQSVTLPPEVSDGVMAALGDAPPDELARPGQAATVLAATLRSALFLPDAPDWWDTRHDGGPRRLVTFGPRRPISAPGEVSVTPLPETFVSLAPLEQPESARQKAQREGPPSDGARAEFILPFDRGRVTSLFHQGRYHPAIDLAGRLGSPVHATTRRQRVTFTGWRRGYGNTVMTRDAAGRTHLYAHLQRVATRVGTMLEQGQTLGLLGSTGRSTGPHVHYEVRTAAGRHINPVSLLFPGRRVGHGFAWNGARSVTRIAAR